MAFMPAVLVAAGIAVLSLWENPYMPEAMRTSDKILHAAVYTVFAVTLMAAFVSIRRTRLSYYVLTCACVTMYGALMEAMQRFCTLTRSGEMADLLADFIGAIVGVLIVALWRICTTSH